MDLKWNYLGLRFEVLVSTRGGMREVIYQTFAIFYQSSVITDICHFQQRKLNQLQMLGPNDMTFATPKIYIDLLLMISSGHL